MANLTGKQLVELGIITNVENEECIQQHGVDLELQVVQKISTMGGGVIPKEGKSVIAPKQTEYLKTREDGTLYWKLPPGVYDVTFRQGCAIPNNQRMEIFQRSSLLRSGQILRSSLFDAGFRTNNIGTVLHIFTPIEIEYHARIGQIVAYESNVVSGEDLYDGQFQNDKQREAGK